jgi:16S rRNA pseudouridine516 synthase
MLASRGKPVQYLKRMKMGKMTLDSALLPGEYRFLTAEEVAELKK